MGTFQFVNFVRVIAVEEFMLPTSGHERRNSCLHALHSVLRDHSYY